MLSPRASRSLLATQTAASRVHTADTHHTQAYPPDNRLTLTPSLTTTHIYTLGANARCAACRNGERVHRSRSGGRRRAKLERHTHQHPLSVPFNRDLMWRSQSAVVASRWRNVTLLKFWSRFCDTCVLQLAWHEPSGGGILLQAARPPPPRRAKN